LYGTRLGIYKMSTAWKEEWKRRLKEISFCNSLLARNIFVEPLSRVICFVMDSICLVLKLEKWQKLCMKHQTGNPPDLVRLWRDFFSVMRLSCSISVWTCYIFSFFLKDAWKESALNVSVEMLACWKWLPSTECSKRRWCIESMLELWKLIIILAMATGLVENLAMVIPAWGIGISLQPIKQWHCANTSWIIVILIWYTELF